MTDTITIPRAEYDHLLAVAEDMADIVAYDRVKAALATGTDELVPAAFADRLLNGEQPLRVWRDLRGLTQAALGERAGVNRVQIADIEAGRKTGSVGTIKKLADALGLSMDDLV